MDIIGWIIGIVGAVIGAASLVFGIMQYRIVKKIEKRNYRISWDLAKSSHILMGRIEKFKDYLDKNDSNFSVRYGRAHQQAINLVRNCLQNVFLTNIPISDKEVGYMRESHFLSGYLDTAFTEMNMNPPKQWQPQNNE